MGNYLNHEPRGGRDLVIGLDAGGTRTRAVLAAAADGRVLDKAGATTTVGRALTGAAAAGTLCEVLLFQTA